jgi:hypothetical protein
VRQDENGLQKNVNWRRRAWIAAAVLCTLLLIFHRVLIFAVAHRVIIHFASLENLRRNFAWKEIRSAA